MKKKVLTSGPCEYLRYFLYRSTKLYIVAFHENRLDEAIMIDDPMYSFLENFKKKNVTNLHQIFFTIWSHGTS